MQKYGQHFLIDKNIINQIIDATVLLNAGNIIEIGPGKGALTSELIARLSTQLSVIEIDPLMVAYLKENFPSDKLAIIQGNFMDVDLSSIINNPTTFVSNLPYIDAADILDKVLNNKFFNSAVFMFQKEQAQRICAKVGEKFYSPISVLSQLRSQVSLLCNVGKNCFNPPPKVESRVLVFKKITPVFTTIQEWNKFKKIVLSAFNYRRKTILNALVLSGYNKTCVETALRNTNLLPTLRAEQISPQQYINLHKNLTD